jgi:acetyltransferase
VNESRDDPALAALRARAPSRTPRVLEAHSATGFTCAASTEVPDKDLAKKLRSRKDQIPVVATGRVSPTLLRALIECPPSLLIVTGDVDQDTMTALRRTDTMRVLGPNAVLRMGKGDTIACATTTHELDALTRALGEPTIRLALCPTPTWLVDWLEHDSHATCSAVGYVHASALTPRWAGWIRKASGLHVLVPLGLAQPQTDTPHDRSLEQAVAAHALERSTGPVFPAPQVLTMVLRGSARESDTKPGEHPPEALALWSQARRALPMTGSVIGMEAPDPGLPLEIPTATFLAQRALLRMRACEELKELEMATPDAPDEEAAERAEQVLASAGEVLSDQESKVVLRGFGIEITRQAVAASASGASQFAERIGFPVVLKAVSPDLRRKREIGAVVLHLVTGAAVRRAYASIVKNVEDRAPTARLDGVLVAEMVDSGLDVVCGGVRMATNEVALYGRVLSASAPIEPVLGLCPLSTEDALLLAHAVLSRVPVPALRRATDPDVQTLAGLFLRLDSLFAHTGNRLRTVDLNPVRLVRTRGYVTLDARITQHAHLEGV